MVKNTCLLWCMFAVASAVHNWGGHLTRNPVFVLVTLFVTAVVWGIIDMFDVR